MIPEIYGDGLYHIVQENVCGEMPKDGENISLFKRQIIG